MLFCWQHIGVHCYPDQERCLPTKVGHILGNNTSHWLLVKYPYPMTHSLHHSRMIARTRRQSEAQFCCSTLLSELNITLKHKYSHVHRSTETLINRISNFVNYGIIQLETRIRIYVSIEKLRIVLFPMHRQCQNVNQWMGEKCSYVRRILVCTTIVDVARTTKFWI